MRWWQSECIKGDMIRVSMGSYYHYGIFVSDDEIIQFGLPPTLNLLNRDFKEIEVCVSDINTFSNGKIVEVAKLEKHDDKRLKASKTVLLARSKIGSKGYDIIHNNCEHFAYYCYFGKNINEERDKIISSWKNREILDVYISHVDFFKEILDVYPKERNEEIKSINNDNLKLEKYSAWKTLEVALLRSLNLKISDLKFKKEKNGKWKCKECEFSISHSKGLVMVAISKAKVGIDVEECESFLAKYQDENLFNRLTNKIIHCNEKLPVDFVELISLWTKKESLYKNEGKKQFFPNKIDTNKFLGHEMNFIFADKKYHVSISSNNKKYNLYSFDSKNISRFKGVID